jgi:carbamoyl-phosphate synthase/aspartate carbamoyltransferase/dihydroorotase
VIRLPGLIDPHVHLREPGATHKEDFDSGTAAALAGGFTAVLAMPNTQPPLTDDPSLKQAQDAARSKARCDYGIFLGAGADNVTTVSNLASQACGLKMYLDQTYGPLHLEGLAVLRDHIAQWPADRPLAVHAEGRSLAAALLITTLFERPLHVCHVSRKDEIALIRKAKEIGLPVTCEVTPHHLFLTADDVPRLGAGRGEVRPRLATASDREALWANLEVIDCFATDHAPHTLSEKDGEDPPPGFPGLETALGLLLTAVNEGRLTLDDLIARSHTNPRRIFELPLQRETFIEVDLGAVWEVRSSQMYTRCGWTPFEGMHLQGQVRRVTLRGQLAYADDEVLVPPGYGKDLSPATQQKIE